ncbi:hypothetical protein COLO4_02183 [Corchorus olitorius]|uniref:Uncharacterized protein n=1 Tax=Corchorus olitorius TaxID=93759 RepID=A0A1R3L1D7_9ROSI|nr:hypothetical protein COLO4_02183 [Corchorus olitorius]
MQSLPEQRPPLTGPAFSEEKVTIIADSEQFIRQAFAQDSRKGYELLYRRYYKVLCSHAVRYVYAREVAEDLHLPGLPVFSRSQTSVLPPSGRIQPKGNIDRSGTGNPAHTGRPPAHFAVYRITQSARRRHSFPAAAVPAGLSAESLSRPNASPSHTNYGTFCYETNGLRTFCRSVIALAATPDGGMARKSPASGNLLCLAGRMGNPEFTIPGQYGSSPAKKPVSTGGNPGSETGRSKILWHLDQLPAAERSGSCIAQSFRWFLRRIGSHFLQNV